VDKGRSRDVDVWERDDLDGGLCWIALRGVGV